MGRTDRKNVVIIRPIWWRQFCFTLFLLVSAVFFAFINFLGTVASWLLTVLLLIAFLLNLLDQLFCWSRLKIDRKSFDLRTWWSRKKYLHPEIKSFELDEYMHRKLIMIRLKEKKNQDEQNQLIPFPCAFGRPVEEILEKLNESIDRTPRKNIKN